MKFLIDVNLPPHFVDWLEARGHEAVYSSEVMSPEAPDRSLCQFARVRDYVVVSKDSDLVDIVRQMPGSRLVWIRCGNMKIAPFKTWFEARADEMLEQLDQGERVVELR